jgi:hypothetical protein
MFIETGEYEVQFSNKKCRKFVEDINFHYIHWGLIGVYLKTREKKKKISTRTPPPRIATDCTTVTKGSTEKTRQIFASLVMDYLVRFAQTHETFRRPELQACATLAGVDIEILSYNEYV